jgi:hypothetical protein
MIVVAASIPAVPAKAAGETVTLLTPIQAGCEATRALGTIIPVQLSGLDTSKTYRMDITVEDLTVTGDPYYMTRRIQQQPGASSGTFQLRIYPIDDMSRGIEAFPMPTGPRFRVRIIMYEVLSGGSLNLVRDWRMFDYNCQDGSYSKLINDG